MPSRIAKISTTRGMPWWALRIATTTIPKAAAAAIGITTPCMNGVSSPAFFRPATSDSTRAAKAAIPMASTTHAPAPEMFVRAIFSRPVPFRL